MGEQVPDEIIEEEKSSPTKVIKKILKIRDKESSDSSDQSDTQPKKTWAFEVDQVQSLRDSALTIQEKQENQENQEKEEKQETESPFGGIKLRKTSTQKRELDEVEIEKITLRKHDFERIPLIEEVHFTLHDISLYFFNKKNFFI